MNLFLCESGDVVDGGAADMRDAGRGENLAEGVRREVGGAGVIYTA